jgi:hypothetical protein
MFLLPARAPSSSPLFATPELLRMTSALLARTGRGALATRGPKGAPHGSIVRVTVDAEGAPLFAIGAGEPHVDHLGRDARASLLVVDPCSQAESRFRVTLTGLAIPARDLPAGPRRTLGRSPSYRLRADRIHVAWPERSVWFRVREGALA